MKTSRKLRPLAITMGEPAGIGAELIIKAWAHRQIGHLPYFIIADYDWLQTANRLNNNLINIEIVQTPDQATPVFDQALPIIHQPLNTKSNFGKLDPINTDAVISAIELSVKMAITGDVSGIVTLPIHKATLYKGGFNHPGHTEFLADLSGAKSKSVMMLANRFLKTVPITIHVSLSKALANLSTHSIVDQGWITHQALKNYFGIAKPRLAVAGLNPHAGEDGAMGTEEINIIIPAINQLRGMGCTVTGPYPPDTLFTEQNRQTYDVALCMYHDQALIPVKALDFSSGVNVTLGLPFIRTSPDHGTATDIAGLNSCNPESLMAAIQMATIMAENVNKQNHHD